MSIGSDISDACYEQYIVENYYGSGSEPISFDDFLEAWKELPAKEQFELVERALRK